MRKHFVWLAGAHDPITDADLTTDDEVEGVSIHEAVGVLPYVEVTLTSPGWQRYAAGSLRAAAVVESVDGTMATARVLARGWLRDLPDTLGKGQVRLTLECSGTVEENRLAKNAAARAWEAANPSDPGEYGVDGALDGDITAVHVPDQDYLLGRQEAERDQVLVGRTLDFHFDPVTHAVTLHDFTVPMGVVRNIGEDYDPRTLSRSAAKGCPKRIKMRVYCNYTPQFSGTCPIPHYLIGSVTSMSGWNYSMQQRSGLNQGWTIGTPTVMTSTGVTASIGTVTQELQQRRVYEDLVPGSSPEQWVRRNGPISWARHTYNLEFRWYSYFFAFWYAGWTYGQPRREVVECVLDIPTQEVTGLVDEIEMPDLPIQPVFSIPMYYLEDRDPLDETPEPPEPYDNDKTYFFGDLVTVEGREYRLNIAESTGVFMVFKGATSSGFIIERDPRWEETGRRPAFEKPVLSIIDQPRGKACIAAAFRILRAKAHEYLYDEVTLDVDRPRYPDWTLGDTVQLMLPGRYDEPMKAAEGRLVGAVQRLTAKGDTVEITIKIGKSAGGTAVARPARINPFGGEEYFAEAYLDTNSTPWLTAGDDIEWTLAMDPIHMPVDPARLGDPMYSIENIFVDGNFDRHLNKIRAMNQQGIQIGGNMSPDLFPPTMINLRFRNIPLDRVIVRKGRAVGTLLRGPKGIDL